MHNGSPGIIDIIYAFTPRRPERIGDYFFYAIEIATWAEAFTAIASARAKGMIPLRIMALLNNVLGFVSGVGHGSLSNVVKHLVNFPLNAVRLREMRRLVAKVRGASETDLKLDWLKPFMHPRVMKEGETIFSKGDEADEAFMLVDGSIEISEASVALGPGEIFGEMALFTGTRRRTASAVCGTDVRLLVITYEAFEQLYFQNPEFGLYLVRLIVRRSQMDRTERKDAADPAPAALTARPQASQGRKQIMVDRPVDVRSELQALAGEQGRTVEDMVAEALDLLFAKYPKPEIAPARGK